MRSEEEIRSYINRLEKNAEGYYNTGTPMAQETAHKLLSIVDVLKWVLSDEE